MLMTHRIPSIPHPVFGVALAAALVSGCGESAASDACAAMRDDCFTNQKVCVEHDGAGQCEACPSGHYAAPEGACQALEGTAITHDFTTFTVKAGEEIRGLCQSWTLGNAEPIWINAVELTQDQLSHHSIWTFVPQEMFEGEDGVWPCQDRGYNELAGTVAGGVLYAQSTQAAHEIQRFPSGSAVRVPPYSKIIGDIHLLNTTGQDVTGHAKLTVYGIPEGDVRVSLVPFEMAFRALAIPPHAQSRFSAQCELQGAFMQTADSPFDLKVHYILPHTHQFATRLFLNVFGGPSDGEMILDVGAYNSEARGRFFDQPIDLAGATGIGFGCEYDNPSNDTLGWAYEQEMCQILGFAESKVAFLSAVWEADEVGTEDGMQLFTGPCENTALLWDFNKPGGMPQ